MRKESVAALALRKKIDEQTAKAKLKKDADVAAFTAKKLAHNANAKGRVSPGAAPRVGYTIAVAPKATRGNSKQPSTASAQVFGTRSPVRPLPVRSVLHGAPELQPQSQSQTQPQSLSPGFSPGRSMMRTMIRTYGDANGAVVTDPTIDENSLTRSENWATQGKVQPSSPSRPVKGGVMTDL